MVKDYYFNKFRACLFGLFAVIIFSSCHDDYQFELQENPPEFPGTRWYQVREPEKFGWSRSVLDSARYFSKAIGSKAVMILDNGRLIDAWGNTTQKYYVASIRKSYLGVLFGFFVDSLISLDATLAEYEIDDIQPSLNAPEKEAKIRHLLTSASGVFHPAAAADNTKLAPRNSQLPGTKFVYNNWDFNVLGTIFEKRTNRKIFEFFHEKIALPIAMEDFICQKDGRYDPSDVSLHPAYHFDMTARDMARFGLLMLKNGNWNGRQILPADWLKTITRPQIPVADEYGGGSYGYMWWVHDGGKIAESGVPKDTFSAQGHWSQFILIIPSQNIVMVHRGYRKNIAPEKLLQLIRIILRSKIG